MNLPNKLTVARTLMVPLFLVFLLVPAIPWHYLWAALVFSLASLTDYFDGYIARKKDIITDFGKFLDPLADKFLVVSAVVAFVSLGLCHPVAAILIIARDFMVSGIRMIAVTKDGKVIAANWWGKIKTATQMIAIVAILAACQAVQGSAAGWELVAFWSNIVLWALALFTLLSGIVYLVQNKHLVDTYK